MMKNKYRVLEARVRSWAAKRDLLDQDPQAQLCKTTEELGELVGAHLRGDTEEVRDGLGDILVTLIIYAEQENYDLLNCLEDVYEEISDRRGRVNESGAFVKEEES